MSWADSAPAVGAPRQSTAKKRQKAKLIHAAARLVGDRARGGPTLESPRALAAPRATWALAVQGAGTRRQKKGGGSLPSAKNVALVSAAGSRKRLRNPMDQRPRGSGTRDYGGSRNEKIQKRFCKTGPRRETKRNGNGSPSINSGRFRIRNEIENI